MKTTNRMKTKSALCGLMLGLRSLAAGIIPASDNRNWRGRWLLLLSLSLAGFAFAPAASAQVAPPVAPNPSLVSPPDILNPPVLVQKLSAHSDPVSAFVWSQLPAAAQQALAGGLISLGTAILIAAFAGAVGTAVWLIWYRNRNPTGAPA